jgi:hypothetical protein
MMTHHTHNTDNAHLVVAVFLVANQHDDSVGIGEIARISKPRGDVVVRHSPRNVVHQQRSSGPAIVRPRHGAKALLPRRVPDL